MCIILWRAGANELHGHFDVVCLFFFFFIYNNLLRDVKLTTRRKTKKQTIFLYNTSIIIYTTILCIIIFYYETEDPKRFNYNTIYIYILVIHDPRACALTRDERTDV